MIMEVFYQPFEKGLIKILLILIELQIVNIIMKLNPKKSHGYDGISIAMLQLCSHGIANPLKIIFQHSLSSGCFPDNWKLANVQPIHKKGADSKKRAIGQFPFFPYVVRS